MLFEKWRVDLSTINTTCTRISATIFTSAPIDNLKGKIDVVPHYLIALLHTAALWRRVNRSDWCKAALLKGLNFVVPDKVADKSVQVEPAAETDPEEIEKKSKKKGIFERDCPSAKPIISNAIRKLWSEGKGLFHAKTSWITTSYFSAFFVQKSNGLLRVILDCRWINVLFKSSESKFSFFSLEALRQVIDNLAPHEKWYAINFDLRHWFHQIALPNRYKTRFGFRLADQKDRFDVYARTCPMGWTMSPLIGQCCTWALLLTTKDNKPLDREAFDLPSPYNLSKVSEPFTWIPLRSGGGIFVLLDNMLVVTPREDVAENWFKHIIANCEDNHAVLKSDHTKDIQETDPAPDPLNCVKSLRAECFFTMTKGSPSFPFTGVEWFHSSHMVKMKKTGDDLMTPDIRDQTARKDPNYDPQKGTWQGTHRELASVVSRLMWHRRVHDIRIYDRLDESKALRECYGKVTPSADKRWCDTVELGPDIARPLTKAWAFRASQTPAPAEPLLQKLTKVIWVAGDAATNENADTPLPPQLAVVTIDPSTGKVMGTPLVIPFPKEDEIAIGELLVILEAVKMHSATYQLIVLATDSMTAKHWVENRGAHNWRALLILKEIEDLLRKNNCRLYLTYVNTLINASDLPSRRPPREALSCIDEDLLAKTNLVLRNADLEARGMWSDHGGLTGGTAVDTSRRQRD